MRVGVEYKAKKVVVEGGDGYAGEERRIRRRGALSHFSFLFPLKMTTILITDPSNESNRRSCYLAVPLLLRFRSQERLPVGTQRSSLPPLRRRIRTISKSAFVLHHSASSRPIAFHRHALNYWKILASERRQRLLRALLAGEDGHEASEEG